MQIEPDFEAWEVVFEDLYKSNGTNIKPYIITVNGHPGLASPNYIGEGDMKGIDNFAFLHWWDNGVYYRMHHENLHVTVDQLMDTAESMY